jgi:RimJ/RimL family protein N-acetyltransferase
MSEQPLVGPLETDRLVLRRFEPDDWKDVHAYASDAETMTYILDFGGPMTEEQARDFVAENLGDQARAFAVVLKAERQLIGHMIFHPWFAPRIYEIGWALNKRYHGQGYATEAAAALLRYGFETLKVHRIIATCQPENAASYRVMEKIGMQREGHFRQCIERDATTWWDEYFYAIVEDDWHHAEAARSAR